MGFWYFYCSPVGGFIAGGLFPLLTAYAAANITNSAANTPIRAYPSTPDNGLDGTAGWTYTCSTKVYPFAVTVIVTSVTDVTLGAVYVRVYVPLLSVVLAVVDSAP